MQLRMICYMKSDDYAKREEIFKLLRISGEKTRW